MILRQKAVSLAWTTDLRQLLREFGKEQLSGLPRSRKTRIGTNELGISMQSKCQQPLLPVARRVHGQIGVGRLGDGMSVSPWCASHVVQALRARPDLHKRKSATMYDVRS